MPVGDYVLGTKDDEVARLGLQHRVWRDRAMDAWRRAGFAPGRSILDIGCGPGFAAIDLAEIVGPAGRVVAVDRSRHFLAALSAAAAERGLRHLEVREMDLDQANFPERSFDGAWSRWVFSFVTNPRRLLERVALSLRPGAALVLHEYFAYETWRAAPRCAELEEFVRTVMASWRASGGEPNVVLDLPRWLAETGFDIASHRPIVELAAPASPEWIWLDAFVQTGLPRLVELGHLSASRAQEIAAGWSTFASSPHVRVFTPGVLEIVAVRR
jgi:ubiquinone/menaquinone biosynthesis C-methylase UbiE